MVYSISGGPIELFLVPDSALQLGYQKPWYFLTISMMVHIKDPLLLIGKSSLYSGSSLSGLLPNVLSASLNKVFH